MNTVAPSALYISPQRANAAPAPSYDDYVSPSTVAYDPRGRLQPYIESPAQRRARAEFLRKREFSRRIAAWLHESSESSDSTRSDNESLRTIDEDDESADGEVIYATPRAWTPAPEPAPAARAPSRNLRPSSRTSSRSSLSSISEESV